MRSLLLLSRLSSILFFMTGLIIACNDLFVGIESSLPVVSTVVSVIFLMIGVFMFALGKTAAGLMNCIEEKGMHRYNKHIMLLNVFFSITSLFGALILYGIIDRISQGISVFG